MHSEQEQGWVPSTYLEPVDREVDGGVTRAGPGQGNPLLAGNEQHVYLMMYSTHVSLSLYGVKHNYG